MSMKSARLFVERMNTDPDFKKKVTECKDERIRMDFVKSHGFDFSREEIEVIKLELSEEDLGNLAGGSCLVHTGIQFYV